MTINQNLANLITEFCKNTITGHESGLYKVKGPEFVKDESMKLLIPFITTNYVNQLYKSLILRDDSYVKEKFDQMTNSMNHSPICLLHFIMKIIMDVHMGLDRKLLRYDSYEEFMKSLEILLDIALEPVKLSLEQSLDHKCTGEKIETCDPNVPLFTLQ